MRMNLVWVGLAISLSAAGAAVADTAGVIQFVAGDVKLVAAAGSERAARKGVLINVGDTLLTATGGLAQLKMGDGAIVVVQPESRLTVAEFHYAGREDGTEKVHYRLERGGFRAVTGAIGRTHKKNYLIETPIAHMGVRGTDHETYYFPVTGPVSGDGAKPGAYNKVNTGMTFIRTDAGEVEIQPNEVGYVASADQVPVILPTLPGFFNRSIAPRAARPSVQPSPAAQPVVLVEQGVESMDGRQLVRPRGPQAPAGSGSGELVGYSIPVGAASFGRSGNGVAVATNGAAFVNAGSDSRAWGSVNWGSWAGGLATVGGQATNGSTHMIIATNLTSAAQLATMAPGVMTATYSYAGGPAPTNGIGTQGAITSLQVGVNFSTQQITNYDLQASALANWNVSGSGSIAQFTGTGGIALGGTCTGCTPGGMPAASGTAHGAFVGSQAEGMTTTFGLTSAGKSLSGAAYLTR